MQKAFHNFLYRCAVIIVMMVMVVPFASLHAAALTTISDLLSTQKASTLANHRIRFITPTGVTTGQTIVLSFHADFTMGSFSVNNIDLAISSGGTCSSFSDATVAASNGAAQWGVAQSGQNITFTAPSSGTPVAASRCIEIEIGSNATSGATGATQITNPATPGTYAIGIAGGTFADSGTATVVIISDDQVQISATVAQTLTFSISDNSIGFGTLDASAARYATGDLAGNAAETGAHDLVAATNATSGYSITVDGATLTSGLNSINSIGASNTASSAGTEQFGLRLTATGGAGAVSAPYAAAGFAFDTAAFPDQVAASTTASATTTYSTRYLANITTATESGAYTTVLTYNATANF